MKNIVLKPLPIEFQDDYITRRCQITRHDDDIALEEKYLWFKFPKSIKPPKDDDCDAYLLAMLMDAMLEGRDIIVKGSVSQDLLANLMEYQAVWNKWLPNDYSIVDICVEAIRDREMTASGAICAFSGGVDATFSVWRHTQKKLKYGSQKINLCALIHGFDIPIQNRYVFEKAFEQSQSVLKDLSLELVPIANNYREISKVPWEHSHACALVAALNNFKHMGGNCIVGSTEPYNALVIPWATSPITDHLLSSGDFKVIHDGASHNRTEKVAEIVDWKVGINNLRVCWENRRANLNCGVCEKCIRTKLNFLASGNPIPDCFPPTSTFYQDIKKIHLSNKISRAYWREIVAMAKSNQINGEWLKLTQKVLNKKYILKTIQKYMLEMVAPQGTERRQQLRNFKIKIQSRYLPRQKIK